MSSKEEPEQKSTSPQDLQKKTEDKATRVLLISCFLIAISLIVFIISFIFFLTKEITVYN